MTQLKKLTLLHSNDMHGDFLAKQTDDDLLGGVSMLSGYLQKVRKEEKNVIYAIAGDMLSGSLIDSEYKGISTIEIMNMLAPDIVTLGNHEVDYGIAHLLFLEKCAQFPIINANMYLTINHARLFQSHKILNVGGMKILFIGVLTREVLASARQDPLVGAFVDVKEAAQEIGKICNVYRTEDIDCTVLLTHIGIESDKELARLLDPRWGVDLIIGGHSHTFMEKPQEVAGIPIVQAAYGTAQIGRFDNLSEGGASSSYFGVSLDEPSNLSWAKESIDEEDYENDEVKEEASVDVPVAEDMPAEEGREACTEARVQDHYSHRRPLKCKGWCEYRRRICKHLCSKDKSC